MSAPTLSQTRLAVGQIGERATAFAAAHRDGNPPPVTTVVTFTVPMSHEDIEAVLWRLLRHEGVTYLRAGGTDHQQAGRGRRRCFGAGQHDQRSASLIAAASIP